MMNRPVKITFSENLKKFLAEKNITQIELSKKVKVTTSSVQRWIKGEVLPNPEMIDMIATFLNIEQYYFFMEPGTQGSIRPTERHDAFKALLDDLAVKCLNEIELESYKKEGAEEYIRVLRTNYETSHILPVQWCLKINQELAKYANVDLQKKLDQLMGVQVAKKA